MSYDSIINNIFNEPVSLINNKKYILIKKNNHRILNKNEDFPLQYITTINNSEIDHSNWVYLWSQKIDNIEYQLSHIENKYPLIGNSINYYIGMAENAISYVRKILNNGLNNKKVISHIRYLNTNNNNPQNIIVDYESRDIAEYIKYAFFNESLSFETIKSIFNRLDLNDDTFELIYGRLFFPTYFFDAYDNIVNNLLDESKLTTIISKTEEYEDCIDSVYELISKYKKIPRISWV